MYSFGSVLTKSKRHHDVHCHPIILLASGLLVSVISRIEDCVGMAEQLASVLGSGPAFGPTATSDFGGCGGNFGFGSTATVTQNPSAAVFYGSGGGGLLDGFGGLGINSAEGRVTGPATSFPVSFNSGSSSDLFEDFGTSNGSNATTQVLPDAPA